MSAVAAPPPVAYRADVTGHGRGVRRLGRSFGYAGRGLGVAWAGGNYRVQVAAAAAVAFVAAAYGVTGAQLGLVVLSIAAVISAEIVNTAVERLCDLVGELHGLGRDPRIRDIKDLAAGAVLVTSLGATGVGLVVFVPLIH